MRNNKENVAAETSYCCCVLECLNGVELTHSQYSIFGLLREVSTRLHQVR
jgi:hypothetical protein